MTTFPGSPRILKGGLVLIDPATSAVLRVIVLQYNPDTLSRTFQVQSVGGQGGDRSEALRLKGPPVETIKVEAEIDATDQLELPDQGQNRVATQFGISPHLAALETIIYPTSGQLQSNNSLAQAGTLEIAPMESPLTLFVWGKTRVLPVRLTELSITEEAFDTADRLAYGKMEYIARYLTCLAERLAAYDLLALPVCDTAGRLLGAVTVDDVLDRTLPVGWRSH